MVTHYEPLELKRGKKFGEVVSGRAGSDCKLLEALPLVRSSIEGTGGRLFAW
jgi:hypothetical protein